MRNIGLLRRRGNPTFQEFEVAEGKSGRKQKVMGLPLKIKDFPDMNFFIFEETSDVQTKLGMRPEEQHVPLFMVCEVKTGYIIGLSRDPEQAVFLAHKKLMSRSPEERKRYFKNPTFQEFEINLIDGKLKVMGIPLKFKRFPTYDFFVFEIPEKMKQFKYAVAEKTSGRWIGVGDDPEEAYFDAAKSLETYTPQEWDEFVKTNLWNPRRRNPEDWYLPERREFNIVAADTGFGSPWRKHKKYKVLGTPVGFKGYENTQFFITTQDELIRPGRVENDVFALARRGPIGAFGKLFGDRITAPIPKFLVYTAKDGVAIARGDTPEEAVFNARRMLATTYPTEEALQESIDYAVKSWGQANNPLNFDPRNFHAFKRSMEDLQGTFNDPIIVRKGTESNFRTRDAQGRPQESEMPGWLIDQIHKERLIEVQKRVPNGTDAEAFAYLMSLAVWEPLSKINHDLYFYLAHKYFKLLGHDLTEHFEIPRFTDGLDRQLQKLKRWIYDEQLKARARRKRQYEVDNPVGGFGDPNNRGIWQEDRAEGFHGWIKYHIPREMRDGLPYTKSSYVSLTGLGHTPNVRFYAFTVAHSIYPVEGRPSKGDQGVPLFGINSVVSDANAEKMAAKAREVIDSLYDHETVIR